MNAALAGFSDHHSVRIQSGASRRVSLSPLDVLRGGDLAEEHVLPLTSILPGQPGALRIVVAYGNLTGTARRLLIITAVIAGLVLAGRVIVMRSMLDNYVSKPLHAYSQLALQAAAGEVSRLPADGHDELSQLGRAINGMADALAYDATVDALTGLYNLRHLSSNLEVLLAGAAAAGRPLSLIVGDLDNLKPVNDAYGHQAGDTVLKAVSSAISSWAGRRYTCWRLGGDEFVVALPNTDEREASVQAARLRRAIGDLRVPVGEAEVRPAMSVGLAAYPVDGSSAGALLGIADRRMYTAKTLNGEGRESPTGRSLNGESQEPSAATAA
jgi:diguanylate cyclase (GGDEF)-like protein